VTPSTGAPPAIPTSRPTPAPLPDPPTFTTKDYRGRKRTGA
jgi:hypothetical protein